MHLVLSYRDEAQKGDKKVVALHLDVSEMQLKQEIWNALEDDSILEWPLKMKQLKKTLDRSRTVQGSLVEMLDRGECFITRQPDYYLCGLNRGVWSHVFWHNRGRNVQALLLGDKKNWAFASYIENEQMIWPIIPKWSPRTHYMLKSSYKEIVWLILLAHYHCPESLFNLLPIELIFVLFGFIWPACGPSLESERKRKRAV